MSAFAACLTLGHITGLLAASDWSVACFLGAGGRGFSPVGWVLSRRVRGCGVPSRCSSPRLSAGIELFFWNLLRVCQYSAYTALS